MARNVFLPSFYRWAMNLPESEPVALLRVLAPQIFAALGGEAVLRHIGFHEAILGRWDSDAERKPGDREAMRCMGAIERGYAKVAALREQAWLQARADVFQRTGQRIPLPQTPESLERHQSAEEAAMVCEMRNQIRAIGAMSDELVAGKVFAGVAGSGQGFGSRSGEGPGEPGSSSFSGGSMPEKVPDPVGSGSGKGSGAFSESEKGSGTISRKQPREMEPDPAQKMSQAPEQTPAFQYAEGPQDEPPTNKQIKLGIQRLIAARIDRPLVLKLRDLGRAGRLTRAKWNDSLHRLLTA